MKSKFEEIFFKMKKNIENKRGIMKFEKTFAYPKYKILEIVEIETKFGNNTYRLFAWISWKITFFPVGYSGKELVSAGRRETQV